jgi:hypothetical protein
MVADVAGAVRSKQMARLLAVPPSGSSVVGDGRVIQIRCVSSRRRNWPGLQFCGKCGNEKAERTINETVPIHC